MTGREKRALGFLLLFLSSFFVIAASYVIGDVYSLKDIWVLVATGVLLLLLGWFCTKTMRRLRIPHGTIVMMGMPFIVWLLLWLIWTMSFRIHVHPPGQEAKHNLLAIQLAVERYNLDQHHYPEFLIGGTTETDDISGWPVASDGDTLVWEGYFFPSYPWLEASRRKPKANALPVYSRRGPDIWHRVFLEKQASFMASIGDFKRLQDELGDIYSVDYHHSRFVDKKETRVYMGNLSADHRYEAAGWGFPYWLRKTGSKDLITITSQFNFYYKSLQSPDAKKPDGYILMVFGPYYEEGQDTFTTVPGGHELDGRLPDGTGVGMGVPVIPELGLEPDGNPDGVIIVLQGGWPWDE